MPSAFEEVRIAWKGREYTIPPDQVMRCIAKVEDIVTLAELQQFSQRQTLPYGKMAMAYGVILRHAGARVSDAEIYNEMFKVGEDARSVAVEAVQNLLLLMIPPEHIAKAQAAQAAAAAEAAEGTGGKSAAGEAG